MKLLPNKDSEAERIVRKWIICFFFIVFFLHFWRIISLNASYDQGLFLQEIWNGLYGRPFESTLASELSAPVLFDDSLPKIGYLHLAQHFTPLLIIWAPLVGVLGIWALPFIQVSLIAISAWFLFLLSKEYLPERIAAWITCSFFSTATVIGPSLENFHDLCLVPLLFFLLLFGIATNKFGLYFFAALLIPLVREDVGLISFGIGFWMILRRPNWRFWGLGLCIYSLIYVLVITNVVMPMFGSEISRRFMQERFQQYLHGEDGGTLDVLVAMVKQPLLLFRELISPPLTTFRFLLTLALPLAFIPWLSLDSWLLIAFPLFVALSSYGGNAMAVSLRFTLYLVPGTFAGVVFWWRKNTVLFARKSFRRFWKFSILIAFIFMLIGNPHRAFSFLIPDSIRPWVYVPIHKSIKTAISTRELISMIPSDASVAAETQLIPQLAQRRVLLRFPENYEYLDLKGNTSKVDYIISQPSYNAIYAPAFRRNLNWLKESVVQLQDLVEKKEYGILSCDDQSIALKKILDTNPELLECFNAEIKLAKEQIHKLEK